MHFHQWKLSVETTNRLSHAIGNQRRIRSGSDHNPDISWWRLPDGPEYFRVRFSVEPIQLEVRNNSDDHMAVNSHAPRIKFLAQRQARSECNRFYAGDRSYDLLKLLVYRFFETLGAPAFLGRTLQASDYQPNSGHVVLISDSMWRQHYGKDPNVIGRRISLDRESYEIVGVMPPGFYPTQSGYPELWMPHWASQSEQQDRVTWG
jgi:hypothetical protein